MHSRKELEKLSLDEAETRVRCKAKKGFVKVHCKQKEAYGKCGALSLVTEHLENGLYLSF